MLEYSTTLKICLEALEEYLKHYKQFSKLFDADSAFLILSIFTFVSGVTPVA